MTTFHDIHLHPDELADILAEHPELEGMEPPRSTAIVQRWLYDRVTAGMTDAVLQERIHTYQKTPVNPDINACPVMGSYPAEEGSYFARTLDGRLQNVYLSADGVVTWFGGIPHNGGILYTDRLVAFEKESHFLNRVGFNDLG